MRVVSKSDDPKSAVKEGSQLGKWLKSVCKVLEASQHKDLNLMPKTYKNVGCVVINFSLSAGRHNQEDPWNCLVCHYILIGEL